MMKPILILIHISIFTCVILATSSCKEDDFTPYDIGNSIVILGKTLSYSDTTQWYLGDSLKFNVGLEVLNPIGVVDISLGRYAANSSNDTGDLYIFESFYPKTKNAIINVKWKIPSDIGSTPNGFYESVIISYTTTNGRGHTESRSLRKFLVR
jgi:hypothetical protein